MNINSTIEFYSHNGGFDHVMSEFSEAKSKLTKEVRDAFEEVGSIPGYRSLLDDSKIKHDSRVLLGNIYTVFT